MLLSQEHEYIGSQKRIDPYEIKSLKSVQAK